MNFSYIDLIENVLSKNNELRKESELKLETARKEDPTSYISGMISLLQTSEKIDIRSFATLQLRKNLSDFTESTYSNVWESITPEVQANVKTCLFNNIETEQNSIIRHQVCDAIGEIGGTLVQSKTNQWPELIPQIYQLLANSRNELIEAGLKILTTLFTYASESFKNNQADLFTIFKQGMIKEDNKIREAAIESLGSYLEVIDTPESKRFEELIPLMLETTYNLLTNDIDKGERALEVLEEIAEAEPKFFKKNFDIVFETMYKITFEKSFAESGVKRISTEFTIAIAERVPSLFKGTPKIEKLIEMIFFHMIDIEKEVTKDWEKPEEGFNDDVDEEADLEAVRFGMNGIDRLISTIGQKDMLSTLSKLVQQMLQQADWRYKHAAIMALSQVGEYLSNIEEVKPIVQLVLSYGNNENAKLRYAVCHCLGQIADDMQPEFQKELHDSVLNNLINLLYDNCPRVVSHAAAAITNFVEGMAIEDLRKYIKTLLQKSFELLGSSISIVKENCVAAISAMAEVAMLDFEPYYADSTSFLFNMLSTHHGKEYRQLRGQLIECLTLIAHAIGYEKFKTYAPSLIETMIQIQEGKMDENDPQKSYILSGWQRLCITMDKHFVPYLPRVLPSLFKLVSEVLKNQGSEDKININTSDTEEAEIAINMISVFVEQLKEEFSEYVETTTQLILPLVNFNTNENIRQASAKCLPGLISSVKSKSIETAAQVSKAFLEVLWSAAHSEYASDIIIHQINSMKDCIEEVGQKFMSPDEISNINQKIFKLLVDSDNRKTENEKFKKLEDVEKEEIELLDEDNSCEEDLHVAIAELIGVLFKTHKELMLPLVEILYKDILSKVLQSNLSDKMHKFGIFLIDDMIEFLGIELIPDKWPYLSEALLKYALDKTCFVRQAAVYGIGILAIKSKDIFGNMASSCVNTLYQALKIPKENEKEKVYGHCRDNVISALGKIIKSQSDKINLNEVIQVWLENLPLKFDKEEAIQQHDLLTDIVLLKSELILGVNGSNIPKIITCYGNILNTKKSNADINKKIKESMDKFRAENLFVTNWGEISRNLNEKQRICLEQL